MKKIISIVICLILSMSLLAGCSEKVTTSTLKPETITIDENNHFIATYKDGTTQDLGEVPTLEAKTITLDENNHVIADYGNGNTVDLGELSGYETEAKTLKEIKVDDEMHAIAYYTDGTNEDLGYVGVEVEPPIYTVTFLDNDGNVLSEQSMYRGHDAVAPTAPQVGNLVFTGWDTDYTNVQSDLTVKPVYQEPQKVTVTFKDDDGTVLKTEEVITGQSAHAPSVGIKGDKIFSNWDKDFSVVGGEMTVTAVYRNRNTYTVTFVDYNGAALGSVSVKEGDNATAPVTPSREGYTFAGWNGSINSISSNKSVTATYKFNGGTNVMDLTSSISGNTLTVTVTMKGSVTFCGMEGNIVVPSGLTYVGASDGDGTVSNYSGGTVYFMFSSSNGKNVTSETRITTLTFNIGSASSVTLATTITDIYDQDYNAVAKTVIGQNIKLK